MINNQNSQALLHYKYCMGIVAGICVVGFAYSYYNEPLTNAFFSFAATLASLILAVLAIVYAIYSNSSSEKNNTRLSDSVNQIDDSAHKVEAASAQLCELIEKLRSETAETKKSIDANTEILNASFGSSTTTSTQTHDHEPSETINSHKIDISIEQTLNIMSFNGLLALYICKKSMATKTRFFDLKKIYPKESKFYAMVGCLSILDATGIIDLANDNIPEYTLNRINPIIDEKITDTINTRAENNNSDAFKAEILHIDNYFNS